MILDGSEDLRVKKTVSGLKYAFKTLLTEGRNADEISVKELCEKAYVNKKTFYNYYKSIGALLAEIKKEYALNFLDGITVYDLPREIGALNQDFFIYVNKQGEAFDRIITSDPVLDIRPVIGVIKESIGWNKSPEFLKLTNYKQDVIVYFSTYTILNMCRQWIIDGKSMPLKQVVAMTNRLIEDGISSFFKG